MNKFQVSSDKRVLDFMSLQIANGKLPLSEGELSRVELNQKSHYIRHNVNGSGIVKLLETSDNYSVGTFSLDNAKLPDQNWFFIEGIRIAIGGSGVAPVAVADYSTVDSSFPAGLVNGHFILKQRSQELVNLPISEFVGEAATTGVNADNYVTINPMKMLVPQQIIEAQIELAASVAKTYAVSITLIGQQTELRIK